MAQIDCTKQASEILRLQKETPSVTEKSATTVQIEKPSGEDISGVAIPEEQSSLGASRPSPVTNQSLLTHLMTPVSTSVSQSSSTAATPVISLLDKIFAGEATVNKDQISFKPSDCISLGAAMSVKIKTKIWNNEFIHLRILLPNFKEDPLSVNIVPGSITLQQPAKKNAPVH